MTSTHVLQFLPLQSIVELPFWGELANRKLDDLKLSEEAVALTGTFSVVNRAGLGPFVRVDHSSFHRIASAMPGTYHLQGVMYNLNTLEGFKSFDRNAALQQVAAEIWNDVCHGAAEENPVLLNRLLLLTFADLKNWLFYYWFAFPALKPPVPFTVSSSRKLSEALGKSKATEVASLCNEWLRGRCTVSQFACLLHLQADQLASLHSLSEWHQLSASNQSAKPTGHIWLLVVDPGPASHPSWLARNLLLLAAKRWHVSEVTLCCVRDIGSGVDDEHTTVHQVQLPVLSEDTCGDADATPAVVGWEKTKAGKLGPRMSDMRNTMDPASLADSAVDLNLRLMRWRFAPKLDTKQLASLKCLLLGAGTLGCSVARGLLGWNVKHITFVDNSSVSFSNPVRQSLYSYEDCLQGGKHKAIAAAEELRRIYPGVQAQGIVMSVPMPGHVVTQTEIPEMRANAERLEELIGTHDVVFLLTDTRESRWLPSLLSAVHGKLAITAALGFDEFVVLRHGGSPVPEGSDCEAAPRLGCYFCNDIVAPTDSTRNRSLDQQCTVSRPGVSALASSLAVELMVNTVQHPLGSSAPGWVGPHDKSEAAVGPMGPVPHMIRGQVSSFSQTCFLGHAFKHCPACSSTVVGAYNSLAWGFLERALQEPRYLADASGLSELQQAAEGLNFEDDEEAMDADDESLGDGWTTL